MEVTEAARQLQAAVGFIEEAMRGGGTVLLHSGYASESRCAAAIVATLAALFLSQTPQTYQSARDQATTALGALMAQPPPLPAQLPEPLGGALRLLARRTSLASASVGRVTPRGDGATTPRGDGATTPA